MERLKLQARPHCAPSFLLSLSHFLWAAVSVGLSCAKKTQTSWGLHTNSSALWLWLGGSKGREECQQHQLAAFYSAALSRHWLTIKLEWLRFSWLLKLMLNPPRIVEHRIRSKWRMGLRYCSSVAGNSLHRAGLAKGNDTEFLKLLIPFPKPLDYAIVNKRSINHGQCVQLREQAMPASQSK